MTGSRIPLAGFSQPWVDIGLPLRDPTELERRAHELALHHGEARKIGFRLRIIV